MSNLITTLMVIGCLRWAYAECAYALLRGDYRRLDESANRHVRHYRCHLTRR